MTHDDDEDLPGDAAESIAELTHRIRCVRMEIRRIARATRHGYPLPKHVRRVVQEARRLRARAILLRRRAAQLYRVH